MAKNLQDLTDEDIKRLNDSTSNDSGGLLWKAASLAKPLTSMVRAGVGSLIAAPEDVYNKVLRPPGMEESNILQEPFKDRQFKSVERAFGMDKNTPSLVEKGYNAVFGSSPNIPKTPAGINQVQNSPTAPKQEIINQNPKPFSTEEAKPFPAENPDEKILEDGSKMVYAGIGNNESKRIFPDGTVEVYARDDSSPAGQKRLGIGLTDQEKVLKDLNNTILTGSEYSRNKAINELGRISKAYEGLNKDKITPYQSGQLDIENKKLIAMEEANKLYKGAERDRKLQEAEEKYSNDFERIWFPQMTNQETGEKSYNVDKGIVRALRSGIPRAKVPSKYIAQMDMQSKRMQKYADEQIKKHPNLNYKDPAVINYLWDAYETTLK